MKKNFIMIALASVLMMPVSCTKNEMDAPQGPSSSEFDLVEMSFTALTEGNGTKTSINLSDGSVNWASGDAIKLTWELAKEVSEASSEVLTADDIVDGSATFKVAVPSDFQNKDTEYTSRHMYAVYPASIELDYSTASSLYVTVPDVQDGTFANASIALAKWYYGKPLAFKNLCGLLQVVVEDAAVRKIVLESSANIAGKVDVGGFDGGVVTVKAVKEGKKTITVNVNGAGTYYIAVLPSSLEGFYMALYDENDELIGDNVSGNTLDVVRKQIRKLGTLKIGFADRLYVKDGGTGDGSSWDNPTDVTGMLAVMQSSAKVVKNIYVAAGDYTIANQGIKPASGTELKIYGGYPANSEGYAVSGRDVESNISRIKNESGRTFYTQSGNWVFDGLYFYSKGYNSGSAFGCALLLLSGTESVLLNNCRFEGNQNVSTGKGGMVRIATAATLRKCVFGNNVSSGYCGGIYVESGTLTAIECQFKSNIAAKAGGSISVAAGAKAILDGCVFEGNTSTAGSGGAILVSGTGMIKATNCTFSGNVSGVNGGAVHFDGNNPGENISSFTNCQFIGNTALTEAENKGLGSAVGSAGTNNAGYVKFERCLFNSNNSYNGGALWTRTVGFRIKDCSFIDNYSTNGGGTILLDGSNSPKVYCDGCYFTFTEETKVGSVPAITINKGNFGMNNSSFAGPWGSKAKAQISNAAISTIVSSTLYGQITDGIVINYGTCSVINSIIPNGASTGMGKSIVNDGDGSLNVDWSLYYSVTGNATTANSLSGVVVRKEAESNFPADGNIWYYGDYSKQFKNNQTSTTNVDDCRGTINYYKWSGVIPSDFDNFTKPSLSEIETKVQRADVDFYSWVSGSLGKDIRGVARNTTSMWPGSYEDATASAGVENLNVK